MIEAPPRKRICVVGGYHKGNLGDDLIQQTMARWLRPHDLTFRWVGERFNVAEMNRFHVIVFGGGSHWPCEFMDFLLEDKITAAIHLVGVSARSSWDRNKTARLLDRATSVVCRDTSSRKMLGGHHKIQVAPDLTWLYPLPMSRFSLRCLRIGLNLRYWPDQTYNSKAITKTLCDAGPDVVPLAFAAGDPEGFPVPTRTDIDVLRGAGLACAERAHPETIGTCQMVVTMRFHVAVLAAQAIVPFIVFDDHPKTRAFALDMGMEDYVVPLEDDAALASTLKRVKQRRCFLRQVLKRRRGFMTRQAQSVYSDVRAVMEG